ncbi:MAG TPA: LysM peptidoglycan-binding domain-containing protein [Verrucomicrobiae bacterium]|nr:LysM peptidoglycan-binding domain-containing protein [Verrucomicrobiae bacterium]
METTLTSQRVHVEALVGRRFRPFALAVVFALSAACERSAPVSDVTAEQEVNYLRAKKLYEQQDFPAAAEFYKKTLSANPDFAKAHLELGLLSDDKLGDPIAAIYHYRRYLELRPDSEKRKLVEDFIERAKLSLAAKLPQSPVVDPGELARLQSDKAALLQENATLRSRVAELEKTVTVTATSAAEPLTAAVVSTPAPISVVTPGSAPPIVMAAAPITVFAEPSTTELSRARTYVVQRGDTLQSLALRYYGTRSAWEKIYQANRGGLPSKDQLKVGQQLMIP